MSRSFTLSDELQSYLVAHTTLVDEIVEDLIAETRSVLPDQVIMQVSAEQAAFLTMLTRLMGARHAVEVGTFTGLSALSIARGMPADGRLTCFDISTEYTEIAARFWKRAGVSDRIDLRIGPAGDRLRELPAEPHLDLAFIDADKPSYPTYWAELVPRMRTGGLILVDNVLWSGKVLDPDSDDPRQQAIVAFNEAVLADDRVELVMLPIGDGLSLARRR